MDGAALAVTQSARDVVAAADRGMTVVPLNTVAQIAPGSTSLVGRNLSPGCRRAAGARETVSRRAGLTFPLIFSRIDSAMGAWEGGRIRRSPGALNSPVGSIAILP